MCRMGGGVFKRRLVHSVTLTIMAYDSFASLLKTLIADVLKCEAHLKTMYICITMCSLAMSPFSHVIL